MGGQELIDRKFFTHNTGFDFAIMTKDGEEDFRSLITIIKNQISIAEQMKEIMRGKQVGSFEKDIKFE